MVSYGVGHYPSSRCFNFPPFRHPYVLIVSRLCVILFLLSIFFFITFPVSTFSFCLSYKLAVVLNQVRRRSADRANYSVNKYTSYVSCHVFFDVRLSQLIHYSL